MITDIAVCHWSRTGEPGRRRALGGSQRDAGRWWPWSRKVALRTGCERWPCSRGRVTPPL